jgi:hypothetical protein
MEQEFYYNCLPNRALPVGMLQAGEVMRQIARFLLLQMMVLGIPSVRAADIGLNLSGTWKMDASRSESAHQAVPIGPVLLVVKQTRTDITIETRRTGAGTTGVQSEVLPYRLNGAETTTVLDGEEPVKTKAHWEGHKLITETERSIHGASVTTRHVHTLNATGKELKVEKTLTVQHGYQFEGAKSYGSGTDVFVKSAE